MLTRDEAKRYEGLGLKEENAYLYTRGHNLFSIVISMGKSVVETHIAEAKKLEPESEHESIYQRHNSFDRTWKAHLFYRYPEMDKIGKDIIKI